MFLRRICRFPYNSLCIPHNTIRRNVSILNLQSVYNSTHHLGNVYIKYGQFKHRSYCDSNESVQIVPVPSMGDSISEGTVIEWLVEPNQSVEQDQVVVVLETDKVSVDVRSPIGGILKKQLASIDDTVHVNSPLFHIVPTEKNMTAQNSMDTQTKAPPPEVNNPPESAKDSIETVNVPNMGDSISEGTIVQFVKGTNEYVNQDEVVVVIETDKVSVDVRAPKSGVVRKLLAKVDQVVSIGSPLFALSVEAEPRETNEPSLKEPNVSNVPKVQVEKESDTMSQTEEKVPPTPSQQVTSEKNGTVYPLMVEPLRVTRREKMSRMRLRTAERLKESQNVTASLTTFQEVDMTNLMDIRKRYKEAFETKHKVKLGFMSAFVKAASASLLEVPGVNAMLDTQNQEIVYRDYVDMSVAVSTPKGLVTPVLRNTECLGFADIEKQLSELAERARTGKISLEEMAGGNFTISNGGVFGSLMGTPIINVPQTGILGMHSTKMRPIVHQGKIVAHPMMYLALTYDHRLVDGREAVLFLKSIVDKIENPERMLLDL